MVHGERDAYFYGTQSAVRNWIGEHSGAVGGGASNSMSRCAENHEIHACRAR